MLHMRFNSTLYQKYFVGLSHLTTLSGSHVVFHKLYTLNCLDFFVGFIHLRTLSRMACVYTETFSNVIHMLPNATSPAIFSVGFSHYTTLSNTAGVCVNAISDDLRITMLHMRFNYTLYQKFSESLSHLTTLSVPHVVFHKLYTQMFRFLCWFYSFEHFVKNGMCIHRSFLNIIHMLLSATSQPIFSTGFRHYTILSNKAGACVKAFSNDLQILMLHMLLNSTYLQL